MRRAVAAVAAAVVCAVLAPAPAAAQEPAGNIGLAGQTAWVRPDGPFQLRVDVDGVRAPDELEVAVTVHRQVRTRSQFVRTLDGELLGRATATHVEPLDELQFGPNGTVITVDLPRLSPGVYPVNVALRDGRGQVADSFATHLVRLPDEEVELPLSVAWVQPVRAAPSLQPDGERRLAEDDLARLRVVGAAMREAPSVTLDATPEALEALETLGETAVLDGLRSIRAEGEVLATPYVDLDVGALVVAGAGERLAPQRVAGEAVLRRLLGTSGEPRLWSLDDPFDGRTLSRLRGIGVSRVVVDEYALEPLDPSQTGGITLARPFVLPDGSGGTMEAAAVDPGLVAHLEHDDPVLGAHHLLADLAVLYFDSPGTERGVVVRPPEGWVPDADLLTIVLRALGNTNHAILRPVTADELFTTVEPLTDDDDRPFERSPALEPNPLDVRGADFRAAATAIATFVGLAGRDHELVPLLERLLLVAEADGLDEAERRRYLGAVNDHVAGVRGGVHLAVDRTFRLTAREGTIPVTFVNENDFPVTVTLVLASDKLEFTDATDDDRSRLVLDDVVLQPGTTTRTVPVKARTSGLFRLQASLLDADGGGELFRTSYSVRSMVASGVGIVLSVGAVLFLLLWWGSHWRTVRRDRRLVEVAH